MGIDSCDKTSSDCIDSDGTFWCRCEKGYYQKVANNKLCVGELFQMSIAQRICRYMLHDSSYETLLVFGPRSC